MSKQRAEIPRHILFGHSRPMQEVQRAVERVSGAAVPILLQGDQGTGKEVIGEEIHRRSPWRSGPFTRVEANKLAAGLREQATRRKVGTSPWQALQLVPAEGPSGTLFVDEVGDLDPSLQTALFSLFSEESDTWFNEETINLEAPRIICSTRRNLEKDVAAGSFRRDLFYRMNVVTIQLPRLRDRKEDIADLTGYFCDVSCLEQNRPCPCIPDRLLRTFLAYDWPGNIRELESCVDAYVSSDGDAAVAEASLSQQTPEGSDRAREAFRNLMPLRDYARQVAAEAEREMILKVLNETQWNRKEAAKVLRVSYPTLLHKLKQTGINRKHRQEPDVVARVPEGRLP